MAGLPPSSPQGSYPTGYFGLPGSVGKVNINNPKSSTVNSIGYSTTTNALLLDISKTTTEIEAEVKSGDIKAIRAVNIGSVPVNINFQYRFWSGAAVDGSDFYHLNYLLNPNEELFIPATRAVISDAEVEPLLGSAESFEPGSTGFNSGHGEFGIAAYLDGGIDSAVTSFQIDNNAGSPATTSPFFRIGDLIQIGTEILRVTGIVKGSTEGTLTVERGVEGSIAASASNNAQILLPYFNCYQPYGKYSSTNHVQTDSLGRFKAYNFFGFGRALTNLQGIVPGSISINFYEAGYQDIITGGGLRLSSNSGLAASTDYQFMVNVDSAGAINIPFTTDSSDVTIGSIIDKIQSKFNSLFYVSGNLFEKKVSIGISLEGNLRVTSGQRLSTSSIRLTDSSGSDTDLWSVGRIPAAPAATTAIDGRLPIETEYDPVTYSSIYKDIFIRDDGNGRLFGRSGSGSCNYETGFIDFTGPPNSHFKVTVAHTSAFSGGIISQETDVTKINSLTKVFGNIFNQRANGMLKIETF